MDDLPLLHSRFQTIPARVSNDPEPGTTAQFLHRATGSLAVEDKSIHRGEIGAFHSLVEDPGWKRPLLPATEVVDDGNHGVGHPGT